MIEVRDVGTYWFTPELLVEGLTTNGMGEELLQHTFNNRK
jgi:hypothetical protein